MTDINEAIKQAQEAASQIVEAEVIEEQPAGTAVAVQTTKPSMETLGNAVGISSSVDDWLKVNEHGLSIGGEKGLTDSVEVRIRMVEDDGFFVKQSIKWGNPVQYASTYDGKSSDKGGNWADQVARVNRMDPKAVVFASADIILELAKPVKLKEKTVAAGTKLGHTLSRSNFSNWAEFYRQVSNAGLLGQEVEAKLSAEEVNGKNGYTWGVIEFELTDPRAVKAAA